MIDGILNVYKESGFTSFDVVAKLRGILKQKKIGHTGTLDPMAEGVLLVCLGKATKLVDMLTAGDKIYRAQMKLGFETDTEDITGNVICRSDSSIIDMVSFEQVQEAILSFIGEYDQVPPMYSAIKKDGKKLYEYARAGIQIEREARHIKIYDIKNIIREEDGTFCFDVHCSKGTYIRSLVRDIGRKLSCYAVLSGLLRLDLHGFQACDALRLSQIEDAVNSQTILDHVLPIDALLTQYPAYEILEDGKKYLQNGNKLSPALLKNPDVHTTQRIRVYMDGNFIALYDYDVHEKIYKPFKMFL